MLVVVKSHFDSHTQTAASVGAIRAAIGQIGSEEFLLLEQNGILVYELLEAPVVGLVEFVHRVLHVDIFVVVVNDGKHHLYLDGLVGQVFEEDGEEILAVATGTIRIEDQAPIGRLFGACARCTGLDTWRGVIR